MSTFQVKCAVNGREVTVETFVTQLLDETVRRLIDETMPKFVRVENQNSPNSLVSPQIKPLVITIGEAAKTLAISSFTVRRLMGARKFASVRVARRTMIPVEAIDAFLEKRMIPARE
jgi:excisionase family DNA binding protein